MDKAWKKYIPAVCGLLGALCLAGTVWAVLSLDTTWLEAYTEGGSGYFGPALGTAGQRLAVAAVLLALAALALLLLRLEGAGRNALFVMLLPVGAAMLLRAACLNYTSTDYTDFLARWVEFFRNNGGFAGLSADLGDYNVPYLYVLAAISYSDVPDLYLIKLFSILADVLLAWGGFRLVRVLRRGRKGDPVPFAAFCLLLFLPTVVLNGAFWGQCDAVYGALVLHALALVLEGRNKSSVALLAVAFSFKLQAIFLIPFWGVLWLARRVRFWELWVFPLTYLATAVPALLLGKPLTDILQVYFNQAGEYAHRLVLNAPTVYQFVPYGAEVDTALAARLGIAAAAVLVFALFTLALWLGRRLDQSALFAMAAVLSIGVPFLLPHMHERYFFLADVITLCWACSDWRRTPAVLAGTASLASYILYLRLKYNHVLRLFGRWFVMGLETLTMLTALVFSTVILVLEIKRCYGRTPEGGTDL